MSRVTAVRYISAFAVGALGYSGLEMLWRSYTHWSMAITGGFCLATLYYVSLHCQSLPLTGRALIGCAAITLYELIAGLIVNLWLGWRVWDYSFLPLNFMGQICLVYSALWYIISFPALYLCDFMEKRFFLALSLKYGEKELIINTEDKGGGEHGSG